tara:strand:- start:289 stop:630 length:342 start_codon:yes stop_codon:yes gene_type:complete
MAKYINITTAGSATTDLITRRSTDNGNIGKITISNNDGHQADNVCLFLEDAKASTSTNAGNNKFYFFKDLDIPMGVTLVLDDNLGFDSMTYSLRIITQNASDGGAPSLSIIIK